MADATIDSAAFAERHPEYAQWERRWADYRLLYKGGDEFIAAAGQSVEGRKDTGAGFSFTTMPNERRVRRFLYQLEGEPDNKYLARWNRAKYTGYLGAIVDYFRHWLFSVDPVIRPGLEDGETTDPPDWYDDFSHNCDGSGTDLLDFVRDVFLDVLLCRHAGWLIARDEDDQPVLTRYPAEDILDWQEDEHGCLEWVLLRRCREVREFPGERVRQEVYTYVDRQSWASWEIQDAQLVPVGGAVHGLDDVPFVWFEIPEGLWVANKLASWQTDLFNQENMLAYGQLVGCFLQPYLRSHEGGAGASERVFGEGILLHLRCGTEGISDEEFGWATPNVDPLKFSAELMRDKRDEGYRIVHQMSLAVDSQAVGAIARSGASKVEDRRATEIILCAFGGYVREAIKRTLDLISLIQGDDVEWTVDGFDNFQVSSLDEELQTAALVNTFDIPSPTFKKEILSQVATGRVLGHVDEAIKQQIREEIAEAVDEETAHAEEMEMAPPPIGGQPDPNAPPPMNGEAPMGDQAPPNGDMPMDDMA